MTRLRVEIATSDAILEHSTELAPLQVSCTPHTRPARPQPCVSSHGRTLCRQRTWNPGDCGAATNLAVNPSIPPTHSALRLTAPVEPRDGGYNHGGGAARPRLGGGSQASTRGLVWAGDGPREGAHGVRGAVWRPRFLRAGSAALLVQIDLAAFTLPRPPCRPPAPACACAYGHRGQAVLGAKARRATCWQWGAVAAGCVLSQALRRLGAAAGRGSHCCCCDRPCVQQRASPHRARPPAPQ